MSQHAEMARHYSNLRFAMFTVFVAILGALISFAVDRDHAALFRFEPQRSLLASAGVLMSICFCLAECRVDYLVHYYQMGVSKSGLPAPPLHNMWVWLVPVIMTVPYAFSLLFWIMFWSGCIKVPMYAAGSA